MPAVGRVALVVSVALASAVGEAAAQEVERVPDRLLLEVMPAADRFDPADGDPPVKRAYRGGELIGYVFLTADLPPQETGYSGPIDALVGMTTEGVLTGVWPTQYRESLRYEWEDFLNEPALLAQFVGKRASDSFGLRQDLDGLSGATISVRALARDVRDSARRIAITYLPPPGGPEPLTEEELATLSWFEMQRRGVAVTMAVRQERRDPFDITLIHMSSEALGRHLMGERYDALAEGIDEAGGADDVLLYVVEGGGFVPSLRSGWGIEQGGRKVELPRERVLDMGRPAGALTGQSLQVGALLLDGADADVTAPLTVVFDRGRPELGIARLGYTSHAAPARLAEGRAADPAAPPSAPVSPETPAGTPTPVAPPADAPAPEAAPAATPSSPAPSAGPPAELGPEPRPPQVDAREAAAGAPARLTVLREARWVVLAIVLACLAFFTEVPALRWASLATTMVLLGWVDGGFLSISHVTGLVWVGPSAIMSDPALLILVAFTVATVLLWGRVFCGYLCPFGALQDFIDHVVPRRWKREPPRGAHAAAWKLKYVILTLIVGASVVGVEASLYQYFEPFGTVFFLSSNVLLWVVAGGLLVASAVIPRFYCRYVCPLGALLAVGSLAALRRIPRVEQCAHCHVCEQKCPTGAIRGARLSFAECVRCNVCEVQLRERRGVCRHDMEEIRPRLVQIQGRGGAPRPRPAAQLPSVAPCSARSSASTERWQRRSSSQ